MNYSTVLFDMYTKKPPNEQGLNQIELLMRKGLIVLNLFSKGEMFYATGYYRFPDDPYMIHTFDQAPDPPVLWQGLPIKNHYNTDG